MPGEDSLKGFNTIVRGLGYRLRKDDEGTPYVPGKHGKVGWHSWGNETVATYSEKRLIKGRLIHHPKCRIWQHGDSEVRILVRQVDMVEVAPLKKPFKKKQISAWNCQKITRKT